jgi:drug/metabolite transporter (DMT)-like permease
MNNMLLVAILAGLGGMLGWGSADFFAKKTIDKVGPIKSLVWGHGFGTALFIILALIQVVILGHSFQQPSGSSAWLSLAGFGLLQMVVYWLLYKGFEKGQLAILNPIFASFTGIVALTAIVAFGEKAGPVLIAALVAIFAGIILLNVDLEGLKAKKLNIAPGLKEVGAATVLAAIWTLGWDRFINDHDSLSYSLWMYSFMTLAAIALAWLMKVKLSGIEPSIWKYLALIGAGEALAYLAVSWGYSSTSLTSVTALISGAFSVPTVILAYIFLKERITRLQAGAIFIIIAGVIGVTVG